MNKKGGIEVEELIKIVLGIIGIIILLTLSVKLIGIFNGENERAQAKATMEEIITVANYIDVGQIKKVLVTKPKDWGFVTINGDLCFCPNIVDLKVHRNSKEQVESYLLNCKSEGICSKGKLKKEVRIETTDLGFTKFLDMSQFREIAIVKQKDYFIFTAQSKIIDSLEGVTLDSKNNDKKTWKWEDYLESNISYHGKNWTLREIMPLYTEMALKNKDTKEITQQVEKNANDLFEELFQRNALCIRFTKDGRKYKIYLTHDGVGNACMQKLYSKKIELISYSKGDINEFPEAEGKAKIIFEIKEKT